MIIIVEGIDRVGKTILCRNIIERYKDSIHFIRFRDNTQYAKHHNNIWINTEKNNTIVSMIEEGIVDNIILDRFHITEFVYGAVDRHYKNEYMYELDARLAAIGTKDTPDIEQDEEEDIVDPGMLFDSHVYRDVVLIYMVPVDIRKSSEEHGHNLERHLKWFDDFYRSTLIKNKIRVDYKTQYLALDFIDKLLGIKEESEEPETPGESVEPSEGEGEKVEDNKVIYEKPIVGKTLESVIQSSGFFNRAK